MNRNGVPPSIERSEIVIRNRLTSVEHCIQDGNLSPTLFNELTYCDRNLERLKKNITNDNYRSIKARLNTLYNRLRAAIDYSWICNDLPRRIGRTSVGGRGRSSCDIDKQISKGNFILIENC